MNEPLKWIKNLILVHFGLRTEEILNKEIKRYPIEKYTLLLDDISLELKKKTASILYILKLVPENKVYKLENFQISNESHISDVCNVLKEKDLEQYAEIWCCKSYNVNSPHYSSGRILFKNSVVDIGQTIEHVWENTPRSLETFDQSADIKYIRVSRIGWGRRYKTEKTTLCLQKQYQYIPYFHLVLFEIERLREKICLFEEFLNTHGIFDFSLEYMYQNHIFYILDWDAFDEVRILNSYKAMLKK